MHPVVELVGFCQTICPSVGMLIFSAETYLFKSIGKRSVLVKSGIAASSRVNTGHKQTMLFLEWFFVAFSIPVTLNQTQQNLFHLFASRERG